MTDAEQAGRGITAELAAAIGQRAVGLAFGDTRAVGDLHLVPVAFVSYGFGALDRSESLGAGGGGGGVVVPLGVYVSDGGRLRFRPNTVAVLALLVPIAATIRATVATIGAARNRRGH
jgi:hypothetical protein